MNPHAPSKCRLDLVRWDSAAELDERMRTTDEPVIRLGNEEHVDQWATTTIDGVLVTLGLDRADQRPELARTGEHALAVIGLNDALFGVDLNRVDTVFKFCFGTPFYEFVDVDTDSVTALFETGVVSLGADGAARWRTDTDLIADFTRCGTEVLLTFSNGGSQSVDLRTGRLRR